ncbi:MAG: hypothetical protein Athens101426_354 [Parcubacteria group bacterium Athens1014_26]|nr:MAG: hypothetical protein Athens101426_354 [Parcubacteria group bacterium Athens1014_26]
MDWLEKLAFGVGIGILAIANFAFVGVVGAIPTYFLWNWLMPEIFALKAITFWQAWGLVFLSGILFKNSSSSKSSSRD